MEELKTQAIIINTKDYLEADKIATVFSLELGKVSVKFNGVRRNGAKLKPLVQPFTFIDIEYFKRGDMLTAKTGSVLDSFSKIIRDYSKTMCAYIVLDILNKVLLKNKPEPEIFLETIKALTNIEDNNSYRTTIDFILKFLDLLGEGLIVNLEGRIYLDTFLNNFTVTRNENCIEIDKKCYQNLTVDQQNDNLNKMTLKMLNNILHLRYDCVLNSFSFL